MNMETTCEPCALRAAGDTARADAIEAIRTQRLALAAVSDGTPSVEINCRACLLRLCEALLHLYSESLVLIAGGDRDAAARPIEHDLLTRLDKEREHRWL